MFPGLTDDEQRSVIGAMRAAVERRAESHPVASSGRARQEAAATMTRAWSPIGSRELRIGLIGLGTMGRNHLRVLRGLSGVRLAAIADPDDAALAAATDGSTAQAFSEPMSMLSEAELDAVVIASPTTSHHPLTLAALDRGLAVLVEKPLAASPDEADDIVAAASARGKPPVQVGHIERFNPAILELGRLLEAGWLSSVFAISSRRAGPFPARIRDVGVTMDLATHDVDILCAIAGERPTRVSAETAKRIHADHEDLLFGLLSFPSGTVAMLDVDWLTPAKRRQLTVARRGGHVRARLPDPAPDVRARDRHDQASTHRRLRTDVRERCRRAAGRHRRAAGGRARVVRASGSRGWPSGRRRLGRTLGCRARRRVVASCS